MSIRDRYGEKRVVRLTPNSTDDPFWRNVHQLAGDNAFLWRRLAMLALRENAGWPLERIGLVFNHHKGHVTRVLEEITALLRNHLANPTLEHTPHDGPQRHPVPPTERTPRTDGVRRPTTAAHDQDPPRVDRRPPHPSRQTT